MSVALPPPPQYITSRDNPLIKRIRQLVRDPVAYRKLGQVWLEGDHLGRAMAVRGLQADVGVFCESKYASTLDSYGMFAPKNVVVPDALFAELTALETPADMGFLWSPGGSQGVEPLMPTVVLDRVQDAGNVGSMLRSAAAFGFKQILALKGTASLWSGKVVRAGMGAHFGLRLIELASLADVQQLQVPLLATSSHQGIWLHQGALPWPCAWIMGHEGQGVADALFDMATHHIRIAQPGGEESLNVAAAAAICFHATAKKP
jgi:RNA methyltransferase, TrmH family